MWADRDPRAELKILNFTSPKGPDGPAPIGIGWWRDICDAACLTILFFFILIDYYLFMSWIKSLSSFKLFIIKRVILYHAVSQQKNFLSNPPRLLILALIAFAFSFGIVI